MQQHFTQKFGTMIIIIQKQAKFNIHLVDKYMYTSYLSVYVVCDFVAQNILYKT